MFHNIWERRDEASLLPSPDVSHSVHHSGGLFTISANREVNLNQECGWHVLCMWVYLWSISTTLSACCIGLIHNRSRWQFPPPAALTHRLPQTERNYCWQGKRQIPLPQITHIYDGLETGGFYTETLPAAASCLLHARGLANLNQFWERRGKIWKELMCTCFISALNGDNVTNSSPKCNKSFPANVNLPDTKDGRTSSTNVLMSGWNINDFKIPTGICQRWLGC